MGFDIGTLIRAGGEGLIGHRQGQQAAVQREAASVQEEEDRKIRELQRQKAMMELAAAGRPPRPRAPSFGGGAGGLSFSGVGTEEEARDILGRNPPDTPDQPFITMNGRRFPDTPEGREAALEWQRRAGASSRVRVPEGAARIQDPNARAVDAAKFDLTTGTGAVGVGALGGDPDEPFDQPALGQDFEELRIKNTLRQQILAENPNLPREQVEAEVNRRIIAAGQ